MAEFCALTLSALLRHFKRQAWVPRLLLSCQRVVTGSGVERIGSQYDISSKIRGERDKWWENSDKQEFMNFVRCTYSFGISQETLLYAIDGRQSI